MCVCECMSTCWTARTRNFQLVGEGGEGRTKIDLKDSCAATGDYVHGVEEETGGE